MNEILTKGFREGDFHSGPPFFKKEESQMSGYIFPDSWPLLGAIPVTAFFLEKIYGKSAKGKRSS